MLQLESDFRDYYDHQFAYFGHVFKRFSTGGMSRRKMYKYLEGIGYQVPVHGTVSAVAQRLTSSAQPGSSPVELVVYLDERAHAGEGKILLPAVDALKFYPSHYCTEFMPVAPDKKGRSLRHLQVGNRSWFILYWSDNDWRSNVGEGGHAVLKEAAPGYDRAVHKPLFAIDFLEINGRLIAIDFNIAPGLAPLQDIVPAKEVVALLEAALCRKDVNKNTKEKGGRRSNLQPTQSIR